MERLEKAWQDWQNFIPEREEARSEAMGKVDLEKKRRLADLKVEQAQIRAKIATLQAEIGMEKVQYVKGAFDARWQVEKAKRREELEEAIAEQIDTHGKTGYQLAQALGTKNINLFYDVKNKGQVYRGEQAKEASHLDWQWSRFTGTQRYGLSTVGELPEEGEVNWAYVLMKGVLGSELEGQECVFDFTNGGYISGNKEVFESDTPANRRKRADTLAQVLAGSYTGKVREAKNPYFEEVEN